MRRPTFVGEGQHLAWRPHQAGLAGVAAALLVAAGLCGPAGADTQLVEHGSCIQTPQHHIELSRMAGEWYQVSRVPNSYETVQECVKTTYTWKQTRNLLKALTEGLNEFGYRVRQHAKVSTRLDDARYLEVASTGVPAVSYHVLDTDYTSFACVYSCLDVGLLKLEVYGTLARTPDTQAAAVCDPVFTRHNLTLHKLQLVRHDDHCPYATTRQRHDDHCPYATTRHHGEGSGGGPYDDAELDDDVTGSGDHGDQGNEDLVRIVVGNEDLHMEDVGDNDDFMVEFNGDGVDQRHTGSNGTGAAPTHHEDEHSDGGAATRGPGVALWLLLGMASLLCHR